MPDFGNKIGDRQEKYSAGCTFIRADNSEHTISLYAEDNVTKDDVDDWASAVGACSNAGLYETRHGSYWFLPNRTDVLAYDEAGKDAVFVFQSGRNPRIFEYVVVPDFDASLYDSAGIDLTAGEVPLIIERTLGILNKSDLLENSQNFVFVKAYLKRGRKKSHITFPDGGVDIEEPTLVGDPGRDPANEVI